MVAFSSIFFALFVALGVFADDGGVLNTDDTDDTFYSSSWNDGTAKMKYINGPGGQFSVNWSGNKGNFVCGKGWNTGGPRNVEYNGTFEPNGNGYLSVYGWTTNPLVEYYIVESYGTHNPSDNPDAKMKGNLTSDGGTYEIMTKIRTNKPSIQGTATFPQFWSIRTSKITEGKVTTGNHFKAWTDAGLKLGKHDYMIVAVEGQDSNGTATITVAGTKPTANREFSMERRKGKLKASRQPTAGQPWPQGMEVGLFELYIVQNLLLLWTGRTRLAVFTFTRRSLRGTPFASQPRPRFQDKTSTESEVLSPSLRRNLFQYTHLCSATIANTAFLTTPTIIWKTIPKKSIKMSSWALKLHLVMDSAGALNDLRGLPYKIRKIETTCETAKLDHLPDLTHKETVKLLDLHEEPGYLGSCHHQASLLKIILDGACKDLWAKPEDQSSTTQQENMPINKFTLFPDLSAELQLKIWRHCLPGPRVIELFRIHSVLGACKDAEEIVRKNYRSVPLRAFGVTFFGPDSMFLLNDNQDTSYLNYNIPSDLHLKVPRDFWYPTFHEASNGVVKLRSVTIPASNFTKWTRNWEEKMQEFLEVMINLETIVLVLRPKHNDKEYEECRRSPLRFTEINLDKCYQTRQRSAVEDFLQDCTTINPRLRALFSRIRFEYVTAKRDNPPPKNLSTMIYEIYAKEGV
ncbi:hypothetical protein G7Y89_g4848 [Cudoniella acicularis]|uniref:endo-1,4-beta-xylanase n=1 Tax=Cudoniella acicularis TaxID=354080 RepID=A0A8H4RQT1_9HELO|nr:hypothetical protein G7Y89_g4848 [Cudoniella acicularis]